MSETDTIQNTVVRTTGGLFIAGTRITLYDVMDYLAADWSPHLIRHWLNLTEQQMADVLQYIDTHRAELEVDHNIEGHAMLLWGTLNAEGWPDLLALRMVTFPPIGLPYDSSDREVWRFAQAQHLLLLTANRRMQGEHTLEHTIREENTPTSLPVLTIGNADRMLETACRERCAIRLVDIGLDLENYLGTGRVFMP